MKQQGLLEAAAKKLEAERLAKTTEEQTKEAERRKNDEKKKQDAKDGKKKEDGKEIMGDISGCKCMCMHVYTCTLVSRVLFNNHYTHPISVACAVFSTCYYCTTHYYLYVLCNLTPLPTQCKSPNP